MRCKCNNISDLKDNKKKRTSNISIKIFVYCRNDLFLKSTGLNKTLKLISRASFHVFFLIKNIEITKFKMTPVARLLQAWTELMQNQHLGAPAPPKP